MGCNMALIPARGGSKSVPRKNIRRLAGKPLIAYAIDTAMQSNLINRVIVSTDDMEIAEIALFYGAEVPFIRPDELAQDDSSEWLTWQHAIKWFTSEYPEQELDALICIPPTSPLRSVQDVDACIKLLAESDADIVITTREARRNPYFNMVYLDENGCADVVISGDAAIHRRQAAPEVFEMTTVSYAARPEFVMATDSLFEGRVRAVLVPEERALDIDTEIDFKFAEFLISR